MAFDGTLRMHGTVGVMMIGFLKDLEGADADFFQLGQFGNGQWCAVNIGAADGTMPGFDAVNLLDGVAHEINIGGRRFAINEHGALLAFFDHAAHLLLNLIHGEGFAVHRFIAAAKTAVDTVVGALIADIERGKQHNAITVDFFFQLVG